MRALLGIAVATAAFIAANTTTAEAAVALTLDLDPDTIYQQIENRPCIIGESSCNNPDDFGLGEIPNGNPSSYDVSSPSYTVAQIRSMVGNVFSVGIDINTTTHPVATEQLDLFTLAINGVIEFIYDPASPGTSFLNNNNGNGFSDAQLDGFDLSGFSGNASVVFRAVVNNATDGKEQFFLISGEPNEVVEPASLALLGSGLLGLGFLRRRKL